MKLILLRFILFYSRFHINENIIPQSLSNNNYMNIIDNFIHCFSFIVQHWNFLQSIIKFASQYVILIYILY
jgi:hypothetical protein